MKGERGYTLVETLIAIAITGFLVTVLGLAVQQVVTVPEKGDDQVDAIHAVQNAAHWVALDGQMALIGQRRRQPHPDFAQWFRHQLHAFAARIYTALLDGANQTIAQDIPSINFTVQGKVIYMTIVATPDSRWNISENQTYQIFMRPTE